MNNNDSYFKSDKGVLALDIGGNKIVCMLGVYRGQHLDILGASKYDKFTGFKGRRVLDFQKAVDDIDYITKKLLASFPSVSTKCIIMNTSIALLKDLSIDFTKNSILETETIFNDNIEHLFIYKRITDKLGLNLIGFMPDVLALSSILLKQVEKDIGSILLDCGQEKISITIYKKGKCENILELPFGGKYITHDIGYGLNVDYKMAESIKLKYSTGVHISDDIQVSFIEKIVNARLQEIFKFINEKLLNFPVSEYPVVVATGGMSKVLGFLELGEDLLQRPIILRYTPVPDCSVLVGSYSENVAAGMLYSIVDEDSILSSIEVADDIKGTNEDIELYNDIYQEEEKPIQFNSLEEIEDPFFTDNDSSDNNKGIDSEILSAIKTNYDNRNDVFESMKVVFDDFF